VIVMKKHAPAFNELRAAVEAAIVEHHAPRQVAAVSGAAELAQLAALHASGAVTDEEFAAAKAKALGM
jgi:hypothetical protein